MNLEIAKFDSGNRFIIMLTKHVSGNHPHPSRICCILLIGSGNCQRLSRVYTYEALPDSFRQVTEEEKW